MLASGEFNAFDILSQIEKKHEVFTEPFPLLIVDDAFPTNVILDAISAFPPSENKEVWEVSHIGNVESKRRSKWQSEYDIPLGILDIVRFMNSALFLRFMTKAFGIEKIMPDPYFTGGGLNESLDGDYLDVHIDGNYHDASGLNRRLNAILYLNPEWEREWGGNFGMYSNNGATLVRDFEPISNRLIIFETSDSSFHGFPDPIKCPPNVSRKSIILYYYTKGQHSLEKVKFTDPHSALWVKHGIKDKHFQTARKFS